MKGRALQMAMNTHEEGGRGGKGMGEKGRRGVLFPSYLAFPICPRDFPLPFPLLLKVSLPLFEFRLSNFFNGSGCVSHFGEENTSSEEAVSTTRRYPGDLFSSSPPPTKGTGCKPELPAVIHSSSSGTPEKGHKLRLRPLQHP